MRHTLIVLLSFAAVSVPAVPVSSPPGMEVYRSPSCGCCLKWVEHLRSNGASIKVHDLQASELDRVKGQRHVPAKLKSCHTGVVAGFVVEGHVPWVDIKKMLDTRPKILGLSVPGMPLGSPGMEDRGGRRQPYDVLSFSEGGVTAVFGSHD